MHLGFHLTLTFKLDHSSFILLVSEYFGFMLTYEKKAKKKYFLKNCFPYSADVIKVKSK